MKIVLIVLSISIVVINGNTESCQTSRELETNCGNYCFKIVRPVLDHTKALQNQVDDFINKKNSLAKLEISENLIQQKLDFQDNKIEQKLEYLSRSLENTLQEKFERLEHFTEEKFELNNKKIELDQNFESINNKTETTIQKQLVDYYAKFQKNIEQLLEAKFGLLDKMIEEKFENQTRLTKLNSDLIAKFENQNSFLQKKLQLLHPKTFMKPLRKIGSKYYYIENTEKVNWFVALHKCQEFGGHLASIQNENEFNSLIQNLKSYSDYWIDINDLGTEGVFLSATTGTAPNYLNWHKDNPSNAFNNEHCVELWYNENHHLMNDVRCNYEEYFICETEYQ